MMEGEARFVMLMSLYSEYDLRVSTGASGWLEIQKSAAQAEGRDNPIFKGALGMLNNVILHSHKSVIRFSDYGAGGNVAAARNLFLGRQAMVVAYGTPGGQRFMWQEEMTDYGNEPTFVAGLIVGMKKTRFNSRDFGVIAADTAAAAP
jgi:N4-gp56 family major capsid protein